MAPSMSLNTQLPKLAASQPQECPRTALPKGTTPQHVESAHAEYAPVKRQPAGQPPFLVDSWLTVENGRDVG